MAQRSNGRAVGVDVVVAGWAEVGDDLFGYGFRFVVDRLLEVGGGPENAGVDDEGVAEGLHGLVFEVVVADLGMLGEEDVAVEAVEGFASVELPADPPAEGFVGDPLRGVVGAL